MVGAHRLAGRLGEGGLGVVYLAQSPSGVPVTVRLVGPELSADPTFRARFAQEVAVGQRARGVCVARYLDADAQADRPWLVTEYVDGPTLGEVVASRGPLGGDRLHALAAGLAEALVSLHRVGVVHRDLKPANVLLGPSGPKVIDFGISRARDVALAGHVVGAATWMAPEQAAGRPVDFGADVFAWASTITYAATGRPPFGSGQAATVLQRVRTQPADLTGVPEELRPVLTAAFAKELLSRPDPARLFSLVTRTSGADPSAATAELLRTRWTPVQPLTPPELAAGAQAAARLDERSDVRTDARPRRRRLQIAAAVVALVVAAGGAAAWALTRPESSTASPPAPRTTTTEAPDDPAATTGSTGTTATTETTTTTIVGTTSTQPFDPQAKFRDIERLLPSGASSSGVIEGPTLHALTAEGTELRVWAYREGTWIQTNLLELDDPVTVSENSLRLVRLTNNISQDVFVEMRGRRAAVVSVFDSFGAFVPFVVPGTQGQDRVESVDQVRVSGRRVRGAVPGSDLLTTWTYDEVARAFVPAGES
jgi:serine/threonine protein kinase